MTHRTPQRSPRSSRRGPTREQAHLPVRTCIGCRRRAPVDALVRLFCAPDGTLGIGQGSGRGAWLCAFPGAVACLDLARERRALDHALRAAIPGATIDDVRARLERSGSASHDGARHSVDRFDRAETAHVGSQEDSDL